MRPIIQTTLAAAICALCAQAQHAHATTYYVRPNGDDNKGGTLSAWRTLDKVNTAPLKAGDTVRFLRGGTWEGTLVLKSGVTYDSYADWGTNPPKPIIRGSVGVGGLNWAPYVDAQHPAASNVYVADASSLIVNETDASGLAISGGLNQLFLNGQRLQRARFPNEGGGMFGKGKNRYIKVGGMTPKDDIHLIEVPRATLPAGLSAEDMVGAEAYAKNADWYLTHYDVRAYGQAMDSNNNIRKGSDLDANGNQLDGQFLYVTGYNSLSNQNMPTYSPLKDFGYWLENKLWMLDQPGEWCFDPATKKLYVRMPDNSSPAGKTLTASVRAHAINAYNVSSVSVNNLAVQETRGDAIWINKAQAVSIKAVDVLHAGDRGIAIIDSQGAANTAHGAIDGVSVNDSVGRAIDLGGDSTRRIDVLNSSINNAGRGYFAWSAVLLGEGSNAKNNTVSNSSYIGIHGAKNNIISGNTVTNSCLEFDDCGAIYTIGRMYFRYDAAGQLIANINSFAVNAKIQNNFVEGALLAQAQDRVDGTPNTSNVSHVKGIYLDDYSSDALVDGNYVSGMDYGVMLHMARNVTVSNNLLVGNDNNQFWMQENGNIPGFDPANPTAPNTWCTAAVNCDPNNYMIGNSFTGNQVANRKLNSLVLATSDYSSTSDIASFSGNRYAMFADASVQPAVFMNDYYPGSTVPDKTFAQWKNLASQDGNSVMFSTASGVIPPQPTAPTLISNGSFESGLNDWSAWRAVWAADTTNCASAGSNCMVATADTEARQAAGTGNLPRFIVNTTHWTKPLTVQAGRRYMLSFDARADNGGESVNVSLLRNGCPDPANGLCWDLASNVTGVALFQNWKHYDRVLTVSKDMLNETRINMEFVAGGAIHLDNVKLVELTLGARAEPMGFYNAGTASKNFDCPSTDSTLCGSYIDLKDGSAVSFPLKLDPKTSKIVVLNAQLWKDLDRDGVPGDGLSNGLDKCASGDAEPVNSQGCPLYQ